MNILFSDSFRVTSYTIEHSKSILFLSLKSLHYLTFIGSVSVSLNSFYIFCNFDVFTKFHSYTRASNFRAYQPPPIPFLFFLPWDNEAKIHLEVFHAFPWVLVSLVHGISLLLVYHFGPPTIVGQGPILNFSWASEREC